MSQRPADPGRDDPGVPDDPGAHRSDNAVRHLFDASDTDSPVLAAGAICWRPGPDGELELLMVESARWGDWSWPKGKLDPGESLPGCAVREVAEETGVVVELGLPLPTVSYVLPDGRDKTVRYWAARVRDTGGRTARPDEIAEASWLPAPAAVERLTRPGDLAPVTELLRLHEAGRLDTRPLLVVRHAKAVSRAHWDGGEADRPLTRRGRRQAVSLGALLASWRPERRLSSPWARCMQTLEPFLDRSVPSHLEGGDLEVVPLLSEDGLDHDPERIRTLLTEVVADLATGGRSTLLCTHRPVLEAVVRELGPHTDRAVRGHLPDGDPWLSPAEVLVLQVRRDAGVDGGRASRRPSSCSPDVPMRIQSVERYRGESARISLS